jgi:hypothetical protein
MSCGSRANQAKPEALSSCSEQLLETATFLRVTAILRPHAFGDLLAENLFSHARIRPRTVAQYGVENALRRREGTLGD